MAGRARQHLLNLLPLRQDETVRAVIRTRNFDVTEGATHLRHPARHHQKTLFARTTPLKADGIIAIDVRPATTHQSATLRTTTSSWSAVWARRFSTDLCSAVGRNTSG